MWIKLIFIWKTSHQEVLALKQNQKASRKLLIEMSSWLECLNLLKGYVLCLVSIFVYYVWQFIGINANFTLTTANSPEYLGTSRPKMCFTWLVKTRTEAPVVKPLMSGSDKYTATKPSLQRPINSWKKTNKQTKQQQQQQQHNQR